MKTFTQFIGLFTQHRTLLWQFALRTVELRHKGSHLGLVWSFLSPLVMLALYVLVFGYIFGGSFGVLPGETKLDYGLGIFLGLALFNFMSDILGNAAGLVASNPNFVKKVVFPLEILPASYVVASLINLMITLCLVFIGLLLSGRMPGVSCLLLPLVLLPVLMLGLGVAWLISSLGVFLRDIAQIMPVCATGLMFASGVFYSSSKIPAGAWQFLKFNPMIHAINNARALVLWDQPLDVSGMSYLYASGMAVMMVGFLCFKRLRSAFADVL